MRKVPAFRYRFPAEETARLAREFAAVLSEERFLTQGRHCEEFERAFAGLSGTAHAAAASSGTGALEAVLRSIGVEGKDVVVPTNTFAATAFAVVHAGGRPVFADCLDDLSLDPDDAERRLTRDCAAIICVHVGGWISPGVEALQDLARRKGLPLVEDCAHAHGSRYRGKHAGSFGVAGAFSFFSTKLMTTGEGGMIVTQDKTLDAKCRLLRDQAKVGGRNYCEEIGHNWRMTEFAALMGLSQLRTLSDSIAQREEIAAIYDSIFSVDGPLSPIRPAREAKPNRYKYVLTMKSAEQDRLKTELQTRYGVSLGGFVYEVPCHLQPAFKRWAKAPLPNAERLAQRHVCPPIFAGLSAADADYAGRSLLAAASLRAAS